MSTRFEGPRRDSVGENRCKNGPRGRNNDYKHSHCAQTVSEANIESSPESERPKMGSGDPFIDLCIGFFKRTQDFGLKYFVPQNTVFCPISTISDKV